VWSACVSKTRHADARKCKCNRRGGREYSQELSPRARRLAHPSNARRLAQEGEQVFACTKCANTCSQLRVLNSIEKRAQVEELRTKGLLPFGVFPLLLLSSGVRGVSESSNWGCSPLPTLSTTPYRLVKHSIVAL
jgi:hypothetical protein